MSMRLLTAAVLAFVLVGCLVIALVSFAPDAFGNGSAHGELSFSRIVLDAKQSPWGKAIGDMDGDGFPDVLAGFARGGVYWYAYPTWTKHFIGNNGGDDLQVADINNDGAVDVITNGEQIVWYENPRGDGGDPGANRWRKHVIDSTTGSHDIVVGDVNGDGSLDVAIRVEFGPTFLYLQNGSDSWTKVAITSASNGNGLALLDVNNDGRVDIVENGYWLEQPPDAVKGTWIRHDFAQWPAGCSVMVGDINRDGRPDIILSPSESAGKISWFEMPTDPLNDTWIEHVILPGVSYVHRIRIADFDKDGNLDVAFAEMDQSKTNRIGVVYNDGTGSSWTVQILGTTAGHNIAVGDIDNDGDVDILNANWRHSNLELWRNDLSAGKPMPYRVLVFSKTLGFRHASIPDGIAGIQSLGAAHNFIVDATEDSTQFTDVNLSRYKTIIFLNPSGEILDPKQRAAFQRYIENGGGFVGIHNAAALLSPTMDKWEWYTKLVGAQYESEISTQPMRLRILTHAHPSTLTLPEVWNFTTEAYNFKQYPKANGVNVLINLEDGSVSGGKMGADHPYSWYHAYCNGRSWYTVGGANPGDYKDPRFRAHILGGIQYAAGVSVPPPVAPQTTLHTFLSTAYVTVYAFLSDVTTFAIRVVRWFLRHFSW
jgi:type 1 glutamine amidotransferase